MSKRALNEKVDAAGLARPEAWAAEIAAELEDELGKMPPGLAVKHLPAVPTVREVRLLLECAKDDPRDYLTLRLFYYTGVRLSELADFRFAHVSYDGGTLFVVSGKGGKDRYVCVDARTLELIRRRQGDHPLADPIIGLSGARIAQVVKEYGLKAGLVQKYEGMERSFSPHSLRHAFASHRYDAGMDLAAIKQLLGHEFLSTTLIYVETSMRHLKKQYRKTDPMREK